MVARPIFVGGTSSHAGKSWMATAICRYLRRRGARVAPFKAQNMSLNSYPCPGGGEIGRAQVVQAQACGLEPRTDMNPILLKPNSMMGSQVVLDGRVWRNLSAREYYTHHEFLFDRVLAAYRRLAAEFEYIVVEGAGSVSEINLRATDLVNLGLARRIQAPGLLVADIDRGGLFASVVGSYCLMDAEERALMRGFAVNRFRGDPTLFGEGVALLENKTGRKCLGVFPFLEDAAIDAEDSVSLEEPAEPAAAEGLPRTAIVRLPRVSNFTDFRLLGFARWVDALPAGDWDWIILPGTKNTAADLRWMRARGLDAWVIAQHRRGARVLGVCGGYQMMGERIEDPHDVESGGVEAGLGLLPVRTVLRKEKTTRAVEAVSPRGARFPAYEIHMGETPRPAGAEPFATVDGEPEGVRAGRCYGTYLHGALECEALVEELLGVRPAPAPPREAVYDKLADWFEQHADAAAFAEMYL